MSDAADAEPAPDACDACHRRSWLLTRLGGHLEPVRGRISRVLELGDAELIAAVGGERRHELERELAAFDPNGARAGVRRAGLEAICRCDPGYPPRLMELAEPPAVLHVAGSVARFLELVAGEPVAIVGARQASPYGLEISRTLGRGLGAAGITVISGMALGVDSAAHTGALAGAGGTVAVLPGGAEKSYPPARRVLHREIRAAGAAISELPGGAAVWRWTFAARNRIIAALAAMTIVVEAGERSGALLTAGFARSLGRVVAAVPGRVTTPQAAGPNGLLSAGANVVRGPQDVLDHLFGSGVRAAVTTRAKPAPELRALLAAIAEGHDPAAAVARAGLSPEQGLAALASLELTGHLRRGTGGHFSIVP